MSEKEKSKGGDVLDGEAVFAAARDVALLEQLFAFLQKHVTDAPVVNRDNVMQVVQGVVALAVSSSKKAADQTHALEVIGHTVALIRRGGG